MSNEWRWVVASYAITWIVLIAYAVYVARRSRDARIAGRGTVE